MHGDCPENLVDKTVWSQPESDLCHLGSVLEMED